MKLINKGQTVTRHAHGAGCTEKHMRHRHSRKKKQNRSADLEHLVVQKKNMKSR